MIEDENVNPECENCNGEGETYHYLVRHDWKVVMFDWQYCTKCFPRSCGVFKDGYDEIEVEEFEELLTKGYKQFD